jgi:hypothetical protein
MSNIVWYLGRIRASRLMPTGEAIIFKSVDIVE